MYISIRHIITKPCTRALKLCILTAGAATLTACASRAEPQARLNPNATTIEVLAPEPVLSADEAPAETSATPQSLDIPEDTPEGGT